MKSAEERKYFIESFTVLVKKLIDKQIFTMLKITILLV